MHGTKSTDCESATKTKVPNPAGESMSRVRQTERVYAKVSVVSYLLS